jgi:WD40 repeat protein
LLGAGLLLDLENADSVHHPIWRTASGGYAVDVSADGRFAAVAHGSREPYDIHFLRTNGERVEEIHSFRSKHNPYGIIMSLSPRGERLCLGNCIVDPATGAELLRLKVNSSGGVACWPNSTQVVTAVTAKALRGQPGSEEQIVLWDANTGKALQTVVYRSVILAIATAPDGKTIAEAGADKMVRLRDAGTLAVTREFRAHNGSITALAFHPHRPILATCSEDLAIKLWDLNADRLLEELRGPLAAPQSLSFSPSGRRLACGTKDHSGWVWEPESLNPDAAAKAKRLEDKP